MSVFMAILENFVALPPTTWHLLTNQLSSLKTFARERPEPLRCSSLFGRRSGHKSVIFRCLSKISIAQQTTSVLPTPAASPTMEVVLGVVNVPPITTSLLTGEMTVPFSPELEQTETNPSASHLLIRIAKKGHVQKVQHALMVLSIPFV